MNYIFLIFFFFFSSRRRHTRYWREWSSDMCSSDLHGHGNTVTVRHVPDLLSLQNSARGQQVGMDDVHRMLAAEHLERLLQENVFAGEHGDIDGVGDLLPQSGLLPGNHVLQPGEVVLGERLAQADAPVDAAG